ncbi:secreted protein [Moniliophthora roreri]|nr:secreted protein [Moniliophthora roreri]
MVQTRTNLRYQPEHHHNRCPQSQQYSWYGNLEKNTRLPASGFSRDTVATDIPRRSRISLSLSASYYANRSSHNPNPFRPSRGKVYWNIKEVR